MIYLPGLSLAWFLLRGAWAVGRGASRAEENESNMSESTSSGSPTLPQPQFLNEPQAVHAVSALEDRGTLFDDAELELTQILSAFRVMQIPAA